MLRFQLVLEIIEKENLLKMYRNKANFIRRFTKLQEKFPHLISNARGRGLMCAFDLPDGKARADFKKNSSKKT